MKIEDCRIGMRVRMNDLARETFPNRQARGTSGTIAGFAKRDLISIKRDGIKFPDPWSPDFWEPDNA